MSLAVLPVLLSPVRTLRDVPDPTDDLLAEVEGDGGMLRPAGARRGGRFVKERSPLLQRAIFALLSAEIISSLGSQMTFWRCRGSS